VWVLRTAALPVRCYPIACFSLVALACTPTRTIFLSQGTTKTTLATKGWGSEDVCRINRQYIGVRRGREQASASSYALRFTCKCIFYRVGLPGLEPGTFSLSVRIRVFAAVPGCSKMSCKSVKSHVGCSLLFTAVHAGLVYWLVYTTSDHELLVIRADAARLHTHIAPNALQPAFFPTHIIPTHSKSYDINDLNDKGRLSSPQTYVVKVVYVVKQTCRHSSGAGVALGLDSHDPLD
jgi:hypothetical protein